MGNKLIIKAIYTKFQLNLIFLAYSNNYGFLIFAFEKSLFLTKLDDLSKYFNEKDFYNY